jgi:hypothetical protein
MRKINHAGGAVLDREFSCPTKDVFTRTVLHVNLEFVVKPQLSGALFLGWNPGPALVEVTAMTKRHGFL